MKIDFIDLKMSLRNKQTLTGYIFVLPSLIVLGFFVVWPIIQSLWLSFHEWSLLELNHPFVGIANQQKLLADSRFWNALGNTFYYTAGVVPVGISLSLISALILNRKLKAVTLFRSIYFWPALGSFAIVAIIWSFLFDPDIGFISYYSRLLHLPTSEWLRSTTWAMPAVIIVAVWKNFGFHMVILLAGLQNIPQVYYEAAKIDGAKGWQRFWYVTFPLLRPSFVFVLITSVISSFQVFDQVFVMTRGGPLFSTETLVTYIYHQGFKLLDMGYASAISWVLFLLIFALAMIQLKCFRFREIY